jgi:ElaA protein
VCRSSWARLAATTAHGLARLRLDVLVTEAGHPHPELDDLDLAPETEHLWVPDGEVPAAYLRVVRRDDGVRIVDRACARADLRRLGLTSALLVDVVARFGAGPLRAFAYSETVPFFARQGFEVHGDLIIVNGGPRLPMYRHPDAPWRE